MVAGEACGNTGKFFRCPYHAWTFKTDGSLLSIPLKKGYENTGLEQCEASQGMAAVKDVRNHRGFVFCRLNPEGQSFEDFFGESLTTLDNMADRSPEGRLEVAGGVMRHAPLQLEDAGRQPDGHLSPHGRARVLGRHRRQGLGAGARRHAQAHGGGAVRALHLAL